MLKLPYEILIQIFDIAREIKTLNNSALSFLDRDFQRHARIDRFNSIKINRSTSKEIKGLEKYLAWSKKNNLPLNLSLFVKNLMLMSRKIEPKALTLSNLTLSNLIIDDPEKNVKILGTISSVKRIESWVVNIFDFLPAKCLQSIKFINLSVMESNFMPFLNSLKNLSVDELVIDFMIIHKSVHKTSRIDTGAFKSIYLKSLGETVPLDWIFTSHATLTKLRLSGMKGSSDKAFIDQLCKFTALETLILGISKIDINDMYNALKNLEFMQSISLSRVEMDEAHLPTLSKLLQLRFKNNAPFEKAIVYYNCPLENQQSQVLVIKELVELELSKCQSDGFRPNFDIVAKF